MTAPHDTLRRQARWRALAAVVLSVAAALVACASDPPPNDALDERPDAELVDGSSSACAADETDCAGQCVSLQTSLLNCGSCGQVCLPEQVCAGGACACVDDRTLCGFECVDVQRDPGHCGGCDVECADGEACRAGVCGAVCRSGQTLCGDVCVDLQSDTQHCGACATPCDAGAAQTARCETGACVRTCNPGFVDVDGFVGCEYACTPTSPRQERCDGVDNDCDGLVDDVDNDLLTAPCPQQEGVCGGTRYLCVAGELRGCSEEDYAAAAAPAVYETGDERLCEGVDNNCDGRVDENCCPVIDLDLIARAADSPVLGVPVGFARVRGAESLSTVVLADIDAWPVSQFGIAEVRGTVTRPVLGIRTVPDERTWGLSVDAELVDGQLRWTTATLAGLRQGFTGTQATGPSGFAYQGGAEVDGRAVRGVTEAKFGEARWVATLREEPRTDDLTLVVQRFTGDGTPADVFVLDAPRPLRTDIVSWANAESITVCVPEDGDVVSPVTCWTFDHDLALLDERSVGAVSVVQLLRAPIDRGDGSASLSLAESVLACDLGRCGSPLLDVRLGAATGPVVAPAGRFSEYMIGGEYEGEGGDRWWLSAAFADTVDPELRVTLQRERAGSVETIATLRSEQLLTLLTVLYRDGIAYPVFRYGAYFDPQKIALIAVTDAGVVLCEPEEAE